MGMLDTLKQKVGLAPAEPPPPALPTSLPAKLLQKASDAVDAHAPKLTWQQRAIGFAVCIVAGLLMSFLVRLRLFVSL
jgi:hypothetical protein